jgi:hypothetical protein
MVTVDGHHGLSCQHGSGRFSRQGRHNQIDELLCRAGISAGTLATRNLYMKILKRPDGITQVRMPWKTGRCSACTQLVQYRDFSRPPLRRRLNPQQTCNTPNHRSPVGPSLAGTPKLKILQKAWPSHIYNPAAYRMDLQHQQLNEEA